MAPRLRIFAGPNGSGKSTIKDKVASINPAWLGIYVNPDEIEKEITENGFLDLAAYNIVATETEILPALRGARQLVNNKLVRNLKSIRVDGSILRFDDIELNSYYVSALADFLHEKLTSARHSFSFETVMSHPNKIEVLKHARSVGFRNYLYYIATEDPEINLSRVRYRVKTGGHDVPPEKTRARYFRSLENLLPAIASTDRAYIFDNSGAESVLLAEVTSGKKITITNSNIPRWFQKYVLERI